MYTGCMSKPILKFTIITYELHSKKTEINSLQQKLHHWCQMCEITWAKTSFNKALSEKEKKKIHTEWWEGRQLLKDLSHRSMAKQPCPSKPDEFHNQTSIQEKETNEKEKLNHHTKRKTTLNTTLKTKCTLLMAYQDSFPLVGHVHARPTYFTTRP